MRRCLIFIIAVTTFSLMGYAEKLAELTDFFQPADLAVDEHQFYVIEKAQVFIYSLEDYSLKRKFGQAGEGPKEFKLNPSGGGLSIVPQKQSLVLNSIGKVSFYTKDGKFIKEIKCNPLSARYKPMGNRFIGGTILMQTNQMAVTINLFDDKLTKIKEIGKLEILSKGRMTLPIPVAKFYPLKNKIAIGGGEEFVINILDADGNKVSAITRDYKRLEVTEKYKQRVLHSFKAGRGTKQAYEIIKNMITFTEYFPAIQSFWADHENIYIQTYLEKDGKYEFFVYDHNGKFLKRLLLPVYYRDGINLFPTAVKNNFFYQLIENEDEEVWELHREKI